MSTTTVEIQDAAGRLRELIALIQRGTEVIIMEEGIPRARLTAVSPQPQPRVPGLHPGAITTTADFDAPLPDDFWLGTREPTL